MNFPDWLDAEKGRAAKLAEHFGVTRGAVSLWRESVPRERMLDIHKLSGGAVTVMEMLGGEPEPAHKRMKAKA